MSTPIPDRITVVPSPSRQQLNDRQHLDYEEHRRELLSWCLNVGKDPVEDLKGYAVTTLIRRSERLDMFYRWVWDERGRYTTDITHDDADQYMRYLASRTEKGRDTIANIQKSIKMLFKWQKHERGGESWDPEVTFSNKSTTTASQDYLSQDERRAIREAALEYDSIPNYHSVTPDERREWTKYLARKFNKPVSEIGPEDWERANGWKIPSLVWVSLDTGLRPIEVKRARSSWVDLDNAVLRIPKEESSKNEGEWVIALQDRTARILGEWIDERKQYPEYEGCDKLWLTRRGNPYGRDMLRHILERLFENVGLDTTNRSTGWYVIRRSTATYMINEADLSTAQMQLRHKDPRTTMRYDQSPVENRKETLDRLG